MLCNLNGKVAVVTGAGLREGDSLAGFGATIAISLAKQGAKLAVLDLKKEDSERTIARLNEENLEGVPYAVDLRDIKATQNTIRQIQKDLGRIDILVNNAGVCMENHLLEVTEEQWDTLSDINGKGAFFAAQEVMKSFARVGAQHNIRSVAILPGPGRTEMTRYWPEEKRSGLTSQMFTKKLVEPEEIARTVLFAVDPIMHSLTGCSIDVNAGLWIG